MSNLFKLNIYFTKITEQVRQLILFIIVGTDVCVEGSKSTRMKPICLKSCLIKNKVEIFEFLTDFIFNIKISILNSQAPFLRKILKTEQWSGYNVYSKIIIHESLEVGGHWPLWWGWKNGCPHKTDKSRTLNPWKLRSRRSLAVVVGMKSWTLKPWKLDSFLEPARSG